MISLERRAAVSNGWRENLLKAIVSNILSSPKFRGNCFNTKDESKAKKIYPRIETAPFMAMYTHKFNLHSHYMKWETLTLISQNTQGLRNNVWHFLLMSQEYFTNLATLYYPWSTQSTAQMTHQTCTFLHLTWTKQISLLRKHTWKIETRWICYKLDSVSTVESKATYPTTTQRSQRPQGREDPLARPLSSTPKGRHAIWKRSKHWKIE